jgi:hypothetical protein
MHSTRRMGRNGVGMDGMGKDGGRSAEIVCTLEINIGSCARDHVRGIMCGSAKTA